MPTMITETVLLLYIIMVRCIAVLLVLTVKFCDACFQCTIFARLL